MLEITNDRTYGLEESVIASGYPMLEEAIDEISFSHQEEVIKKIIRLKVNDPTITNKDIAENLKDGIQATVEEIEKFVTTIVKRITNLGTVPTGTGHDNFLKGIIVQFDIKYPGYWTSQFQRYNFVDIISSMSKMHRLVKMDLNKSFNKYVDDSVIQTLSWYIQAYNHCVESKSKTCRLFTPLHGDMVLSVLTPDKDGIFSDEEQKTMTENLTEIHGELKFTEYTRYELYMKVISNCPMGFEMSMRVTTSYLQLKTIYQQRNNHKLKEDWSAFCDWCLTLPLFKDICMRKV